MLLFPEQQLGTGCPSRSCVFNAGGQDLMENSELRIQRQRILSGEERNKGARPCFFPCQENTGGQQPVPSPRLCSLSGVQAAAWATTAGREAGKSFQTLSTMPKPTWQQGRGEQGAGIASTAVLVCRDLLPFLTAHASLPARRCSLWSDRAGKGRTCPNTPLPPSLPFPHDFNVE